MIALAKQEHIIPLPIQTKSNEWYTPAKYIEAARTVMGAIDLDPASCEVANQVVKAAQYYSEKQDGLTQPWHGRIWLNPPYGKINNRSTIDLWIRKLISAYQSREVEQAILLTTCDSDNQWFQLLWNYLICFTNHNVHFFKPINGVIRKDSRSTQMFGTVFTYIGPNEQAFIDTFRQFGTIAKAIAGPYHEAEQPHLWTGVPS